MTGQLFGPGARSLAGQLQLVVQSRPVASGSNPHGSARGAHRGHQPVDEQLVKLDGRGARLRGL